MTFQEQLLQSISDEESTRFEFLQNFWEIAYESHGVRTFQNAERS